VNANKPRKWQTGSKRLRESLCRVRLIQKWVAAVPILAIGMVAAPVLLTARQERTQQQVQAKAHKQTPQEHQKTIHRFFDKTNLALFAGVAAVRTLDFTSTEHFREQGNNEVLLTNNIVDNKALFASIEVGGVAASIGVSYWLHRAGHHKLERWVSIIHIGIGTIGVIHNYSLGPAQ
jgi:hypothetical protein